MHLRTIGYGSVPHKKKERVATGTGETKRKNTLAKKVNSKQTIVIHSFFTFIPSVGLRKLRGRNFWVIGFLRSFFFLQLHTKKFLSKLFAIELSAVLSMVHYEMKRWKRRGEVSWVRLSDWVLVRRARELGEYGKMQRKKERERISHFNL